MKDTPTISRAGYPQLDLIAWHMGGAKTLTRKEAFDLYESHWAYVEVADLTEDEIALISSLAKTEGRGVFAPVRGQPIHIHGIICA